MKTLLFVFAFVCLGGSIACADEKPGASAAKPKAPDEPKAAEEKVMEEKWNHFAVVDGIHLKGEFIDIDPKTDDRLYFRYGSITDSGVELERIVGGKVVWRSHVKPLGVPHSKYNHKVVVHMQKGSFLVISLGAKRIAESHDLATGKMLSRKITDVQE